MPRVRIPERRGPVAHPDVQDIVAEVGAQRVVIEEETEVEHTGLGPFREAATPGHRVGQLEIAGGERQQPLSGVRHDIDCDPGPGREVLVLTFQARLTAQSRGSDGHTRVGERHRAGRRGSVRLHAVSEREIVWQRNPVGARSVEDRRALVVGQCALHGAVGEVDQLGGRRA